MGAKTKTAGRAANDRPFLRELAKKHGVAEEAVTELYAALQRGGGTMAQFSHPDLGGSGQWMSNGMIMIGDMFNNALKAKVDALCQALLPHLAATSETPTASATPKERQASSAWWPAEFTSPAATGGQNDFRYAYFPRENALVVESKGKTEVYDTTGHELHGFGQQQPSAGRFTLQSARGTVDISKLPKKKFSSQRK